MSFAVLFVCTGNVCRSPMAERIFAARLRGDPSMTASSAGLRALTRYPLDAHSATALTELGIDPHHHFARQLDAQLVTVADLVLTATTAQRTIVTRQDPQIYRRTFTLLEFGRLAADIAADGSDRHPTDALRRARVAAVAGRRGQSAVVDSGDDDIADPYGRSLDAARAAAARISHGVDAVLAVLG